MAKRNGNPIKQWFITFPKSGDMARKEFVEMFPPSTWAGCCKEDHEDGTPHLHLLVRFIKGISKPKLKKWIEAKFPNDCKRIDYDPTKDWANTENYIQKEDPDAYYVKTEQKRKKRYTEAEAISDVQNSILEEIINRKEVEREIRRREHLESLCTLSDDDIKFMYKISKPEYVLENNLS